MKKWTPVHYSVVMFCFLWITLSWAALYPFEAIQQNTVAISIVYAALKAVFGTLVYFLGLSVLKWEFTRKGRKFDAVIRIPFRKI